MLSPATRVCVFLFGFLCCGLGAAAAEDAERKANEAGWRTLFNGRDLDGWRANRSPEAFTVVDGAIKAQAVKGMSHLFYVGDEKPYERFKDFELEIVARAEPQSNSGLFIHTSYAPRPGRFLTHGYLGEGYEVQLNSTEREKKKTGSLYAVADIDESPVDETKWFTMRVRVEGKRIRVWLNDQLVNDYTEPANPQRPADRAGRVLNPNGGAIALQAHDPGSVFYFRSVRIRELEPNADKR